MFSSVANVPLNPWTSMEFVDLVSRLSGLPGVPTSTDGFTEYAEDLIANCSGISSMLEKVKEELIFRQQILSDTGYQVKTEGRCYRVTTRTVIFKPKISRADIERFVRVEQESWYGQQFSSSIEDQTVHIKRVVDSGD